MNQQPFESPPRWWPSKLNRFLIWACRRSRMKDLVQGQKITNIEVTGGESLQGLLKTGARIVLTPNHSFHYDSYVLIEVASILKTAFHFMTAWQVFAMSSRFSRWILQRHGCFSINREGNDTQAFRHGIDLLVKTPYPLVVFPEGDIYHCSEQLTPFREGAAAIAQIAAKKIDAPVYLVPCALKCRYIQDPTPDLEKLMEKLERSIHWKPRPHLPLLDRVYQFGEALLSLKELEHLGKPGAGPLPARIEELRQSILHRLESKHASGKLKKYAPSAIPERVKELRQYLIKQSENFNEPRASATGTIVPVANARGSFFDSRTESGGSRPPLARADEPQRDMEDLFLVIQLYSYPGDYVQKKPTIERLAETLDKFEEDVLHAEYPTPRGERQATVSFGEPILVTRERAESAVDLTRELERRVQNHLTQGSSIP